MVFIDLNCNCPKCHTSSSTRKEWTHEFWENHFLPTDGLLALDGEVEGGGGGEGRLFFISLLTDE
jgi:hypothetical protein